MIKRRNTLLIDNYFYLFIILILFLGTPVNNKLSINYDEGIVGQCFKLPYLFLYISLFRRIRHVTFTIIDKSLIFLLVIAIIISIFILHKSASFGVLWQLIVIPLFISCYLNTVSPKNYLNMRPLIIAFFVIECLMAIYEGITQTILINTGKYEMFDGLGDFRAQALHGHGLQNSFITIVIGVSILFSDYSTLKKYCLFILGCCAIMAFNTRSGFYIYIGIFVLHFLYSIFFKNKMSFKKRFYIALVFGMLTFLLPTLISDFGLGSRLFLDSNNDGGSTLVRLVTFDFISSQPILNLIIGLPDGSTETFLKRTGIVAIENSMLILLFYNGFLFLIPYMYVMYRKLKELIIDKFTLVIFCLMLIALYNVNNIIASSTPSMIIVFICIYAFIIPSNKYVN